MLYHLLADRLNGSLIETASDGLAAQVRVPILQPHLVIADLLMPRLDGAALCRWVRARGCPNAKVLILTACDGNGLLAQARAAGADAWFQKPPRIAAFMSTVRRLLSEAVHQSVSP
jgi:CheY-like chemotaxis protein